MPLTIISRRTITYRETGRGEMTVLLVPGRDQIQVVKDLAGLGSSPVATKDATAGSKAVPIKKQVQLSRVFIGRRFIYGNLPQEINDLRQPVKIWLAEDFAPMQSQAFFYIISNTVVIHGVREQDDEGFHSWRTAQLAVDAADPLKSIINAISDYAMANPAENLTVAVFNKLDLYEKLQQGLVTYNISPIPFSKLKPLPNVKPLYRHRDYTVLYLTLALFGFIGLMASIAYAILTWVNLENLKEEAEGIQQRINEIKLNENVGAISDPQAVLKAMSRAINQQPSAIVDAVGMAASEMGTISSIRVSFTGDNRDIGGTPSEPGTLSILTTINKFSQDMLLMQEKEAKQTLINRPWIREIRRGGAVGTTGDIVLVVQVDQIPGSAPPPAPVLTEQPVVASSPTATLTESISGTVVSGTEAVSGTVDTTSATAQPVSATAPSTPASKEGTSQ